MDGSFSRCSATPGGTGRRGACRRPGYRGWGATIQRGALACVAAALLSGCATAPRCGPAMGAPMLVVDLFFGRAMAGRGEVTDAEWARFVDRVVIPSLPAGFTVLDADGAWINPATHVTSRERSKLLIVALPDIANSLTAVASVRGTYQREFHQQLVGTTVMPACGSF